MGVQARRRIVRVEAHPIRVVALDELRRPRLTVLVRGFLAIPHLLWLSGWGVVALGAALVQWPYLLVRGRPAHGLFGFLADFLRYSLHVGSYVSLASNPFPDFLGRPGYAVDLVVDGPSAQARWKTLFRPLLALPAVVFASVLGQVVNLVAVGSWFTCLVLGRLPKGLRDLLVYCLRYQQQAQGYLLLVTDRYPRLASAESYVDLAELIQPPLPPVIEAPAQVQPWAPAAFPVTRACPFCRRDWGVGPTCERCGQVDGLPAGLRLSSVGKRFGEYLLELVLALALLAIGWFVWSLIVWKRGQTPAKQVLKMRIVHLSPPREAAGWSRTALREFVGKGLLGLVATVTLGLGYVLYFWLLWDRNRQELWDKLADTIVVDDPRDWLGRSRASPLEPRRPTDVPLPIDPG
jgi:uncharacterized RDD family membrane protein YckC